MPPVKKCSSPAFSIDRRGGSDENFFCRDLGEFAPACRRRRGWPSALDQHRQARQRRERSVGRGPGAGHSPLYMQRAVRGCCRSADNLLRGWSIWPALSHRPSSSSSSSIRSKAVPDSAAQRGHLGGLLRTLRRAQMVALPRTLAESRPSGGRALGRTLAGWA